MSFIIETSRCTTSKNKLIFLYLKTRSWKCHTLNIIYIKLPTVRHALACGQHVCGLNKSWKILLTWKFLVIWYTDIQLMRRWVALYFKSGMHWLHTCFLDEHYNLLCATKSFSSKHIPWKLILSSTDLQKQRHETSSNEGACKCRLRSSWLQIWI